MSFEVGRITYLIEADDSPLAQGLRRADARLGEFARDTERKGGRISKAIGGIAASLPAHLAAAASFGAITMGMQKAFAAADAYDASLRKLEATAKIAGQNIGFLRKTAIDAQQAFGLSTGTAAEFATEISKLTSKAGEVEQTGAAIAAFLDLGAARGMGTTQTLQAVSQAILGIDEGTDKLFGKNPSVLYEEFAASVGMSAGKLTDAGKAQALLAAALNDGGKVAGEFAKWLESPAGEAYKLQVRTEELAAATGRAMAGIRTAAYPTLAGLAEGALRAVTEIQVLGAQLPVFLAGVRLEIAKLDESTGNVFEGIFRGLEEWNERYDALLTRLPTALRVPLQAARGLDVGRMAVAAGADATQMGAEEAAAELERLRESAAREIERIRREMDLSLEVTGSTDPLKTFAEAFGENAAEAERAAKKLRDELEKLDETVRRGATLGMAIPYSGIPLTEEGRSRQREEALRRDQARAMGLDLTPRTGRQTIQQRFAGQVEKEAEELVRAAAEVAGGIVDMADAFGMLDDRSRRALSGISGVVGALDGLGEKTGAALAGGVMSALGAGAQLVASLLGGGEHTRAVRENSSELRATRQELAGLNFRGVGGVTNLRPVVQQGIDALSTGPDPMSIGNVQLRARVIEEHNQRLAAVLAAAGYSFDDMKRAAEAWNITLDGSAETWRQFHDRLGLATQQLLGFGTGLEGQRQKLSVREELYDVTDPAQQMQGAYGIMESVSPELLRRYGMAGLDLSQAADRSAFDQGLKKIFEVYAKDPASLEALLGGYGSGDEFWDLALSAERAGDAAEEMANRFNEVSQNVPRALNRALLEYRASTAGLPLEAPPIPLGGAGPRDTGGSVPTGDVHLHFAAGAIVTQAKDGQALLEEIATAAAARPDSAGARRLRLATKPRGW